MAFPMKFVVATTALTIATAAVVSVFITPQRSSDEAIASVNSSLTVSASPVIEYSQQELASMTPEQLIEMQKDSVNAAISATSESEQVSVVRERPEYISPAEWLIINAVAERHATPDEELVRLVNLMRFNKQREALAKTDSEETRKQLAESLLNQIPARVQNQELTKESAQAMQLDMISQLYSDKADIRARAAEEAERIGAGFDVKAS
ncbi:MAG: hypothetical protein VW258_00805 [Thalassolituus sp.]